MPGHAGVMGGVLGIAVAEVILHRAQIGPLIRKVIAAAVTQHVRPHPGDGDLGKTRRRHAARDHALPLDRGCPVGRTNARTWDLPLSVRGGGHDWAGRSLCGGLVIDLTGMRRVDAYLENCTARIGGGARAFDAIHAIHPHGLAAVTGACGGVGMAGLTLGAGYGSLIGRFGLALDNLLAAEIVLADGRIVIGMRPRRVRAEAQLHLPSCRRCPPPPDRAHVRCGDALHR